MIRNRDLKTLFNDYQAKLANAQNELQQFQKVNTTLDKLHKHLILLKFYTNIERC